MLAICWSPVKGHEWRLGAIGCDKQNHYKKGQDPKLVCTWKKKPSFGQQLWSEENFAGQASWRPPWHRWSAGGSSAGNPSALADSTKKERRYFTLRRKNRRRQEQWQRTVTYTGVVNSTKLSVVVGAITIGI